MFQVLNIVVWLWVTFKFFIFADESQPETIEANNDSSCE